MNCKECHEKALRRPARPAVRPCVECAQEHLRLGEVAGRDGRRYQVVWHLARASELAPAASKALRAARIDYQKLGHVIDWNHLRGLIK
jgi:hypothetical protein